MITETHIRAGLIGAKLGHSFSPRIHAALADYPYELFELEEQEVGSFLQKGDFDALNVTIPYKKTVMPFLQEISPEARRIGAVNTILRRPDGSLVGHNTDYAGFSDLVQDCGVPLQGKKVLVLGSGGASRTAVTVATDMGARAVAVISRNGEDNYNNLERHADAEIIINATPVGMYPKNGAAPLSLSAFPCLQAVLDMIYNPARTALLLEAEARGIPHRNGLLMLVSQARRAAELFLNTVIGDNEVTRITNAIARDTENIILIGMPGCGKSTLGKEIAARLGRELVDCDAEIVKAAGCPIPQIFAERGEEGFRAIETEVLGELSKKSALVIATGGGVVTRERNYPLMHQNGRILFLDIAPDALPTDGRPLSQKRSPAVLYAERLPLYRKMADEIIQIDRDIAKNTERIMEVLAK
ncbi:MAG: shikimate kinase [Ruminococcaceae bacterium]|nr:shikimate kinase [Oscillospiraceae bacterium]